MELCFQPSEEKRERVEDTCVGRFYGLALEVAHNISAHISLARAQSHDCSEMQGRVEKIRTVSSKNNVYFTLQRRQSYKRFSLRQLFYSGMEKCFMCSIHFVI